MIPRSIIQEIVEKAPLLQIASARVQLKKSGREWRGLSPFQQEKTPSFFINEVKNRFFCFSSNKHGTAIDFVMATEGLSFKEAIEKLASMCGIMLQDAKKETSRDRALRVDLSDVLSETQQWFKGNLNGRIGDVARDYLKGRGLLVGTTLALGLGYAPVERGALAAFLDRQGFQRTLQVQAGVLGVSEQGREFGFLRERVTFPIQERATVVAHSGRAMGRDSPKYLHSRASLLFDKSRTLFNLDNAREVIRAEKRSLVMEGCFDVAQATQAGFGNAVGALGTALALEQLSYLWRLAPVICCCLDGDSAGRRAGARLVETALPALTGERRLEFVVLPSGHDPDSLIRDLGAGAFQRLLDKPTPCVEMAWTTIRAQVQGDGPEARAEAERKVHASVGLIADPVLKRAYADELLSRARSIGRTSLYVSASTQVVDISISVREAAIALAAARHPEYVEPHLEQFASLNFSAPVAQRVASGVIEHISSGSSMVNYSTEMSTLEARLPSPFPRFVLSSDPAGFMTAMNLQVSETARRKARKS